MKKRFIYYICMLAIIVACGDDFTQKPAIGALSDEALRNEQGVDLLLVGAYSALDGIRNNQGASDWTVSGDNWWFDVIADDAHKGSTDGDQADLFALEVYNWSTGNPYIFGKWNGLFAGVNRANAVIDLISQIEEGDDSVAIAPVSDGGPAVIGGDASEVTIDPALLDQIKTVAAEIRTKYVSGQ